MHVHNPIVQGQILNKYKDVIHVSTHIVQRLFTALYCIKKLYKNLLNFYSLKVKNLTMIVFKMRVLGQTNKRPPPFYLGLNNSRYGIIWRTVFHRAVLVTPRIEKDLNQI